MVNLDNTAMNYAVSGATSGFSMLAKPITLIISALIFIVIVLVVKNIIK